MKEEDIHEQIDLLSDQLVDVGSLIIDGMSVMELSERLNHHNRVKHELEEAVISLHEIGGER